MTTPLQIIPADVRSFAQDQLSSAGGFMASPAPPPPGDDGDDPTKSATGEFTDNVHRARTTLKQRSDRHADAMTTAANVLENQDQQNAQAISTISPKDQAGLFTGVVKDLTATMTGAAQSLSAAVFAGVASSTQAFGTGINTAMSAAQTGSKMAPDHADAGAAAGPSAGIGAAPIGGGGDGKDKPAETKPASATTTPTLSDAGKSSGRVGYAHTEQQDRDAEIRPAGFAMPGGAASGLSGMGASSGAATVKKARIVTGDEQPQPDEPATGPIDVTRLKRAVASI